MDPLFYGENESIPRSGSGFPLGIPVDSNGEIINIINSWETLNESAVVNATGSGNINYDVWSGARIQRVITLAILIICSAIGNSVIIFILFCSRYHKQLSRVNIFIINLAVGDLAVCLVTMTSELLFEIFQEWKLGNIGCKVIMYTQLVTLSSTTYILMAMSWDRFKAICQPLDFNPSPSKARKLVAAAWLAAFILNVPYFFIYVQVEDIRSDGTSVFFCYSAGYTANWQKKLNFIYLTCSVLIFPAGWIAFCYYSVARVVWQQGSYQKTASIDGFTLLRKTCDVRTIPRAKIKVTKMSLVIVITFVFCWTPYFVVYNIRIFSDYKIRIPDSVITVADTLALMNSCADPIIYFFFNLRHGLKGACCNNLTNSRSDNTALTVSRSTGNENTDFIGSEELRYKRSGRMSNGRGSRNRTLDRQPSESRMLHERLMASPNLSPETQNSNFHNQQSTSKESGVRQCSPCSRVDPPPEEITTEI